MGAGQNLAEDDIAAAITATEPERLKALILGGAFGAGFGAAFRGSPAVRAAVEAKLAPEEVKALDEAVAELPVAEPPRADESSPVEISPETKPDVEIGAETPAVEQQRAPVVDQPVTVAEAGGPEGTAIPAAPERQAATPEAAKLIADLDESGIGVPETITPVVKRIAEENGVTVTPESTPNEVIEGLRKVVAGEAPAAAVDPAVPVSEAPEALTTPKPRPPADPAKPFGETPEGIVRAPHEDERPGTSAMKAYIARDRERMGLNRLPSPEREAWRKSIDEAKEKGLDGEAESMAASVLETPRRLSRLESAAMVKRMADLNAQFDASRKRLRALTDDTDIKHQERISDDLKNRFDKVSQALRYNTSEAGRDLNFVKLTIDDDYNILPVLTRAKANKGKVLEPKEEARIESLVEVVKTKDAQLEEMRVKLRDAEARTAITERRRSPRRPQEVKQSIADLTEKTRRLLRAGCLTS